MSLDSLVDELVDEAISIYTEVILNTSQGSTATLPIRSSPSSGKMASASPSPTTTDVAQSLWGIANSLLTSYYPSTTLNGVATLSWPDTVVIGGTTYNVNSHSRSQSSPLPTSTPFPISTPTSLSTHRAVVSTTPTATADAAASQGGLDLGDKKLGIILGCVIGLVCLILLGVVFWCLKRRKDDTGSFFMRRSSPSNASRSTGRSWLPANRPNTFGDTTYVRTGHADPDPWEKQQLRVSVRPAMAQPRMSQHPAFTGAAAAAAAPAPAMMETYESSRSTSDDNPFYTPAERMDTQLGQERDLEQGPYDPHPVELDDDSRPRSSHSMHASGDRPPTPFSPMEMMGYGHSRAAPAQQISTRDFGQGENPAQGQSRSMNPFTSPEDEEQDLVSPILPTRSPERRHSPMVHYPSWSEVSEFDFHGDGKRGLRNVESRETDGGDGWHAVPERTVGRYELA